ncbi:MAG: hypothetical protein IJS39_16210 [Synergistaceae bacterium]|nr:hypothetical protein [Synergistaceae bacterium]
MPGKIQALTLSLSSYMPVRVSRELHHSHTVSGQDTVSARHHQPSKSHSLFCAVNVPVISSGFGIFQGAYDLEQVSQKISLLDAK